MRKGYRKWTSRDKRVRRQWRKAQTGKARQLQLVLDAEEVLAMLQDSLTDYATEIGLKVAGLLLEDEVNQQCGLRYERVRERTAELARTNVALQRTTDHLSLILESLPIVSYTRDGTGKFQFSYISNSIGEVTGYAANAFTEDGTFWLSRIHPDDKPRVLKTIRGERAPINANTVFSLPMIPTAGSPIFGGSSSSRISQRPISSVSGRM